VSGRAKGPATGSDPAERAQATTGGLLLEGGTEEESETWRRGVGGRRVWRKRLG